MSADPSQRQGGTRSRKSVVFTWKTRFRAPASSPKQTPCNIHATITMQTATLLCTHATCMQPLQCVVQPKLPKHHATAKRRNTQDTSNQHLHCELRRAQPAPAAHASCLSSPAAAALPEKNRFRAPASSPKQTPCNIIMQIATLLCTHATFMQPLQCVAQPRLPKHHVTAKRRSTQNTSNRT